MHDGRVEETIPVPLYIGYKVTARQDARHMIAPPAMPKNITKPETIEKWRTENLPEEWRKYDIASAWCKLTGHLLEIYVVAPDKKCVQHFKDDKTDKKKTASAQFVTWLVATYPNAFHRYARGLGRVNGVAIYGFDPKNFVRVAGYEAALAGVDVPIGFWYQNEDVHDPYAMVVESEQRDQVTVYKALHVAGIKFDPEYRRHSDVMEDARLAAELCRAYRLVNLPSAFESLQTDLLAALVPQEHSPAEEASVDEDAGDEEEVEEDVDDEGDVEDDDEEVVDEDEETAPPPARTTKKVVKRAVPVKTRRVTGK